MKYIRKFYEVGKTYTKDIDTVSLFLSSFLEDVEVLVWYCKKFLPMSELGNINEFISEYVDMSKRNNQWVGGPLNKEWANKWYKKFGHDTPTTDWKPVFILELKWEDGSTSLPGFSILNKELCGFFGNVQPDDNIGGDFYKRFHHNKFYHSYDQYFGTIHDFLPKLTFNWMKTED